MPFNIFTNSTTAYANEVIDNFYHIAQGDRLPRGASSMTAVDVTYDIGTTVHRWKDLFCNNLYVYSSIASSNIIRKFHSSYVSTTSRVLIEGLNGDSYDYIISVSYASSLTSAILDTWLNQSTGTTLYNSRRIGERSSSLTSENLTGNSRWQLVFDSTESQSSFYYGYLHAKTSEVKQLNGFSNSRSSVRVSNNLDTWGNTSDTVTSIVFVPTKTVINFRVGIWEIER